MKKVVLLVAFVALCSSIFAQSKTEFKEQLTAVEAELTQLKRIDSINNVLYQAKLKNLEEQIASLTSTINTQNTALKNYADQVERQNNEINALSRLVAIDSALRNSSSTNASPRERILIFTNNNNTFKVPEGKTWVIHDFKSVNYCNDEKGNLPVSFVTVTGTHINKHPYEGHYQSGTIVLSEGSEITLEIRLLADRRDDWKYSISSPAPSDAVHCIGLTEYDNE